MILGFAAVGAYIGSAAITGTVLGLSGAAIGWSIGAYVGAMLTAPDINHEGPRIADTKVSGGGYGVGIPIPYACPRITGNIIWSSDLIETVTEEEVGKGPSYTSTTYTYSVNCAVGVCLGPIDCIRKIWCNGKLIYDVSGTTPVDNTIIRGDDLTIYLGTETQLPDAFMQSALGAANVPAYRGLAYVVFENLQLAKFGNRVPKFDFEIGNGGVNIVGLSEGSYKVFNSTQFGVWLPTYNADYDNTQDFAWWTFSNGADYLSVVIEDSTNGYPVTYRNLKTTDNGVTWTVGPDYQFDIYDEWFVGPDPTQGPAYAIKNGDVYIPLMDQDVTIGAEKRIILKTTDGLTFTDVGNWPSPNNSIRMKVRSFKYVAEIDKFLLTLSPTGSGATAGDLYIYSSSDLASWTLHNTTQYGAELYHSGQVVYFKGNYYFSQTSANRVYPTYNPGSILIKKTATWTTYSTVLTRAPITVPGDSDPRVIWASHLETNGEVLVHMWLDACSGPNTNTGAQQNPKLYVEHSTDGTTWSAPQELSTGAYPFQEGLKYEGGHFFIANYAQPSDTDPGSHIVWWSTDGINWNTTILDDTDPDYGYLGIDRISVMSGNACGLNTESLASVVTDLAQRAGLTSADLDVTDIGGIGVKGYAITREMTVRSAIEALLAAYSVDAFESDGKIKFVRKSAGYVGPTVPEADLGAITSGNTSDAVERVLLTRKQELELPNEILIRYIDRDLNYDANQQYARRIVSRSDNVFTLDVPLVMSADEAIQLANSILYRAWTQRDEYSFVTTHKYSASEPTDVLFIPYGGANQEVRVVKKEESGVQINWTAVHEDLSLYTQSRTSAGGAAVAPGVVVYDESNLMVFETPVLRDSDDNLQFTVVCGAATGGVWPGANLFVMAKGTTSPLTLINTKVSTLTAPAVMGALTANFAPITDPIADAFDTTTVLSVSIPFGTLESHTEDEVRSGFNCAVVQRADGTVEVLGFCTATLVSPGNYQLTKLLRRIRQTNAYSGGLTGDKFALLRPGSTQLVPVQLPDVGATFEFRAPIFGQAIDEAASAFVTLEGMSKKPLSPVNVSGTRPSPPGDITITWDRRTRIGGSFATGENGPLGEAREAYELDIMSATSPKTVLRTLTSSTPSVTYTQANQIADFGSPVPTEIEVNVYQLSDFVGRGYPANALI